MRDIESLLAQAAEKCTQAHRVLLQRGASVIHETGHGKAQDGELPNFTYGFQANPAVVRMALSSSEKANQGFVTIYVRANSLRGKSLKERLPQDVICKKEYFPNGVKKPAASVLACPYMGPKNGHRALRLHVAPSALNALLDLYLDTTPTHPQAPLPVAASTTLADDAQQSPQAAKLLQPWMPIGSRPCWSGAARLASKANK